MDHILHVRTPKIQCFGKTVRYPTYKTSFVNSDVYFFFKIGKKSKYPSLKLANLCIAKFQSTWQFSNLKKMYVWQLFWFTVTESGICSTMFSKMNEYVVQKKNKKVAQQLLSYILAKPKLSTIYEGYRYPEFVM